MSAVDIALMNTWNDKQTQTQTQFSFIYFSQQWQRVAYNDVVVTTMRWQLVRKPLAATQHYIISIKCCTWSSEAHANSEYWISCWMYRWWPEAMESLNVNSTSSLCLCFSQVRRFQRKTINSVICLSNAILAWWMAFHFVEYATYAHCGDTINWLVYFGSSARRCDGILLPRMVMMKNL